MKLSSVAIRAIKADFTRVLDAIESSGDYGRVDLAVVFHNGQVKATELTTTCRRQFEADNGESLVAIPDAPYRGPSKFLRN